MQSHVQQTYNKDELAALRREAGQWLKDRREALGMSQRELATKVGIEYYTFISQIEAGRGRVPAERYEAYALALDIEPREFTKTMLRYNDTVVYNLLFGAESQARLSMKHVRHRCTSWKSASPSWNRV